jgi:hypothetical protein
MVAMLKWIKIIGIVSLIIMALIAFMIVFFVTAHIYNRLYGNNCKDMQYNDIIDFANNAIYNSAETSVGNLTLGSWHPKSIEISRITRDLVFKDDQSMDAISVHYTLRGQHQELFQMWIYRSCEIQWVLSSNSGKEPGRYQEIWRRE